MSDVDPNRPHMGDLRTAGALLLLAGARGEDGRSDEAAVRQLVALLDPADVAAVLIAVVRLHEHRASTMDGDPREGWLYLGELVRGLNMWEHP